VGTHEKFDTVFSRPFCYTIHSTIGSVIGIILCYCRLSVRLSRCALEFGTFSVGT